MQKGDTVRLHPWITEDHFRSLWIVRAAVSDLAGKRFRVFDTTDDPSWGLLVRLEPTSETFAYWFKCCWFEVLETKR